MCTQNLVCAPGERMHFQRVVLTKALSGVILGRHGAPFALIHDRHALSEVRVPSDAGILSFRWVSADVRPPTPGNASRFSGFELTHQPGVRALGAGKHQHAGGFFIQTVHHAGRSGSPPGGFPASDKGAALTMVPVLCPRPDGR